MGAPACAWSNGGPARHAGAPTCTSEVRQMVCAQGLRFIAHRNQPGFWESHGNHIYGDPWKEQRYDRRLRKREIPSPPTAASLRPRLVWREAEELEVIAETSAPPGAWCAGCPERPGTSPDSTVDLRLDGGRWLPSRRRSTTPSPPLPRRRRLELTVERIDRGRGPRLFLNERRSRTGGIASSCADPSAATSPWTGLAARARTSWSGRRLRASSPSLAMLSATAPTPSHAQPPRTPLFSARALESINYRQRARGDEEGTIPSSRSSPR
jgi:hypothetical protein